MVVIGMDKCLQPCARQCLVNHVITDHITAIGIQNPADDMSHKPHADDCHRLARNHLRLVDPLQGDSAQSAERCLTVIGQFFRNLVSMVRLTRLISQ